MNHYENELQKLETLQTFESSQCYFETPFRAIIFGKLRVKKCL